MAFTLSPRRVPPFAAGPAPQCPMVGGVYIDDTGLLARAVLDLLGETAGPEFTLMDKVDACHDHHDMAGPSQGDLRHAFRSN